MSCYVPMIEKLKSAISQKNNSLENSGAIAKSKKFQRGQSESGIATREIQQIYPRENNNGGQNNPEDYLSRADIGGFHLHLFKLKVI